MTKYGAKKRLLGSFELNPDSRLEFKAESNVICRKVEDIN